MLTLAGLALAFAIGLLITVPLAAIRHGKDMAATGLVTSALVASCALLGAAVGMVVE